jgi:3-isopropylmalate/(R)-2-methylmalate dehydratase large subunit|tara:strand:- start:1877 stop:3283 length:1407 start_codon:yes stop_codon:yes gene_type:complete
MPLTLFEKIWNSHRIIEGENQPDLIYIDRIFLHERTGSFALKSLKERGLSVKNPKHVFATMDHIIDTFPGRGDETLMPGGKKFITTMRYLAKEFNITLFDIDDPRHGISHLISAEQGITLPGSIVTCPDSHTCTLGALGAIGWGVGSSDCEHALATTTLSGIKPKQMKVTFNGKLNEGVNPKDMMLHLIEKYSASGGSGYAIEFSGDTIHMMPIENRFTLCNMAVEFSAFTGIIAPDQKVFKYLKDRPYSPTNNWSENIKHWKCLASDDNAVFDKYIEINASDIYPSVTWGLSPEESIPINGKIPRANNLTNHEKNKDMASTLEYMGLKNGQSLMGLPIDAAFIGSCTNARLTDLRSAAKILKNNKISPNIKAICTPGSADVKKQAEQEGIDKIFKDAGFQWREPGCSLCFYAGGEGFLPQQRVITSTNRNFRGRQGNGVRSHLASPVTVAASAIAGKIVPPQTITKQ